MTRFAILLATLGCTACGSSDDATVGSFDDELPDFVETLCTYQSTCSGDDKAACKADITRDMGDAKTQLDDAGDAACAECMHVKSAEIQKALDASCDVSAADTQTILAACGADDEYCAGYP